MRDEHDSKLRPGILQTQRCCLIRQQEGIHWQRTASDPIAGDNDDVAIADLPNDAEPFGHHCAKQCRAIRHIGVLTEGVNPCTATVPCHRRQLWFLDRMTGEMVLYPAAPFDG